MSTARDMTLLGRHMIYDWPEYYNIFSRLEADAGVTRVANTNRRFLNGYSGADGIKTGYTRAAGSNLVASAQRGSERIIVTVFGAQGSANRAARVSQLMDLGFDRAPSRVALNRPLRPPYVGNIDTFRVSGLVTHSLRPQARPAIPAVNAEVLAALVAANSGAPHGQGADGAVLTTAPPARPAAPEQLIEASAQQSPEQEVVERLSTSSGRHWGINIGRYTSRYQAERALLRIALNEMSTLDGTLRRVIQGGGGFDANFQGLTRETADLACRRLQARGTHCFMIAPSGG